MDCLHVAAERTHSLDVKISGASIMLTVTSTRLQATRLRLSLICNMARMSRARHRRRRTERLLKRRRDLILFCNNLILQAVELCLTHVHLQPAAALALAMHACEARRSCRPVYWPVSGEYISFRGERWVDKWDSERVRSPTT